MYKYIETELINIPKGFSEVGQKSDLEALRKKYPGMKYLVGKNKDKTVVFVLKDITTKEYAEPIESEEYPGVAFYAPKEIPNDIQKFLDENKVNADIDERKVQVTLPNGIKLVIIPATLEPKKVLLSMTKPVSIKGDNFFGTSQYGMLAYKIYNEVKEKGGIEVSSDDCVKLISLALRKSYNIPIDVWNWLEIVGSESLDPLLSAACGVGEEVVLKKN